MWFLVVNGSNRLNGFLSTEPKMKRKQKKSWTHSQTNFFPHSKPINVYTFNCFHKKPSYTIFDLWPFSSGGWLMRVHSMH